MAEGMGIPEGNEDEDYMIKEEKMKEKENRRRMRKKGVIMKRKEGFSLVPLCLNWLQFD
jgi:hypothetical protein